VVFNGTLVSLDGKYGALDGLVIANEGGPGDFDIYIDNLANGTNGVFQDFEGGTNGQVAYVFQQPSFSGSTFGILGSPNSTTITTNTSFGGAKCAHVQWQYLDDAPRDWVRLTSSGAAPVQNPEVDLDEPITFRLLLLPAGTPVPPPLSLSITQSGNNAVLNWFGAAQLESSTSVDGPYADVAGVTTAPYNAPLSSAPVYYRLRRIN
jgi:hypothetical protein